jgi:kynurenine 3-monooxygenase
VWKDVAAVSTLVPGRKEWTSKKLEGTEIILTSERKYATHVLARDRLVSVLHQHVKENYPNQINLHYEHDVRPVSFEENCVIVEVAEKKETSSWKNVTTRFLVAADGSARNFANRIAQDDIEQGVDDPFRIVRYEDDNPRVFKSIPFSVPAHWRNDLNYAVRSEDGRVIFDALPADGKGGYIGTLLLRENDEMAQPNVNPVKFGEFVDEYLPQFSSRLPDELVGQVAAAPATRLPKFRYVEPRLQHMGRTVLLGDCAHTVKPYFGMGANSALEDVKVSDCDVQIAT